MSQQHTESPRSKENQVLEHVLSHQEAQNSPEKVILLIEEFARTERLMIIGPEKGKLVREGILQKEPTIVMELGCYIGYSAILFGSELKKQNAKYSQKSNTPAKYFSFEINEEYAEIAQKIVAFAGLTDTVEIIIGPAGRSIPEFQHRLKKQFKRYTPADIVFIDHAKELYVPDLRVLESCGLIAPETVIYADNIFHPGAPEYVQYVQSSPEYRRNHNDRIMNMSNPECGGRWNLLYESETVPVQESHSGFKDAVEITRCVAYLSG